MNCPNCNGKTIVQESRRGDLVVIRHRKCPGCKLRFRTVEMIEDPLVTEKILAMRRRYHE